MFKLKPFSSFLLSSVIALSLTTIFSCDKKNKGNGDVDIVEFSGNKLVKKVYIDEIKNYALASYIRVENKIYQDYYFEVIDPSNVNITLKDFVAFKADRVGTYTIQFFLKTEVKSAILFYSIAEVRDSENNVCHLNKSDNNKYMFFSFSIYNNCSAPFIDPVGGAYIDMPSDDVLPIVFKEPIVFGIHSKKVYSIVLHKKGDINFHYSSDDDLQERDFLDKLYLFARFSNIKKDDSKFSIGSVNKLKIDELYDEQVTIRNNDRVYFELDTLNPSYCYQPYIRNVIHKEGGLEIYDFPYLIYDNNFNLLVNIKNVNKAIIMIKNTNTDISNLINFAYVCRRNPSLENVTFRNNVIDINSPIDYSNSTVAFNLKKYVLENDANSHLCFFTNKGAITYPFLAPSLLTIYIDGTRYDFYKESFIEITDGDRIGYKLTHEITSSQKKIYIDSMAVYFDNYIDLVDMFIELKKD